MTDKESIYELQKIDCNCNNCIFMWRDTETFNKWANWHQTIELDLFEKAKAKAIVEAEAIEDEANRMGMLRVANRMRFQFERTGLINYGKCSRLGKNVAFLPNICQLETQSCFIHRKDLAL